MGKIVFFSFLMTLSLFATAQIESTVVDSISYNEADKGSDALTFKKVDSMPEYPGGEDRLYRYLNNLPYPMKAAVWQKEGTAYIRFVIDESGNVVDVSLIKSSGHDILDEAALKRVMNMRKWKPGYHNGKPVRVEFTRPLSYIL